MKYIIVDAGGHSKELIADKPLSLELLQKLVGGYIEYQPISENLMAVINEEGHLQNLPENYVFPNWLGTVVVGKMEKGEFIGLPEKKKPKQMMPAPFAYWY